MTPPTADEIERVRFEAQARLDCRSEDEELSVDYLTATERALAFVQGKVDSPLEI